MHIEFLLEEPSSEAFLQEIIWKLLPAGTTWNAHVFQGKRDLLAKIQSRLKAYRKWLPADWKIVVLVDEDRQDCRALKQQLEVAARDAGLSTKSTLKDGKFVVLNRIAVEELEAWFFGDPTAMCIAYPGVPKSLGAKAPYRKPDEIAGGTWEALERVLQRAGYFKGGLPKIEVARQISKHMEPNRNTSPSFNCFIEGLKAL